jgi:hypothetical protein
MASDCPLRRPEMRASHAIFCHTVCGSALIISHHLSPPPDRTITLSTRCSVAAAPVHQTLLWASPMRRSPTSRAHATRPPSPGPSTQVGRQGGVAAGMLVPRKGHRHAWWLIIRSVTDEIYCRGLRAVDTLRFLLTYPCAVPGTHDFACARGRPAFWEQLYLFVPPPCPPALLPCPRCLSPHLCRGAAHLARG